ncbi:tRNA modification GTPase TrmE [Chloroherpeton thalassium ATCC 35110]|uniref:tRNA modification GTPase MnmE n=1 Tax=Chloroherpeton thalassium (strain ATCC 35110 / GB-78) TaxID=517418 RepID=B3QWR0_CHLT3|nr:tRNA modification GTPase TrmE [Chloroherpeton thalassium ATCC 35110]
MDDLHFVEDRHHPARPQGQLEAIAAVATPVGEGALSIVRMTGEGVLAVADKVFRKIDGDNFSFASCRSHTAHYGRFNNLAGELIDEVMAIVYRAPRSFTTEDMVEFNCHGGVIVTETVLQTLLEAGCRLAEPGEFTRRAFLNGRIDLVQAEAVGEMIHAKTQTAYRSAISQLKGDLSLKLGSLRTELLNACSMLELELDFSEEDVEFQSREALSARLSAMATELEALANTFRFGKFVKEGVATAIVGRPNAGKSTLLNALLGKERAIVSHVPGTTRDYIEESFVLDGVPFRLIDTAGLRLSDDALESEGIRRSYEKITEADLVIFVHDATEKITEAERTEILALRKKSAHAKFFIVANKIDCVTGAPNFANAPDEQEHIEVVPISALRREGLSELRQKMKTLATGLEKLNEGSLVITNQRHFEAIKNALERLQVARELLIEGAETELIASDLREVLHQIGSIIGKVTTDDILNNIFDRFCIGK